MKRPELGQRRQKGDFRVGQFMIPNIQSTKRRMTGQVVEIPVVAAVLFRVMESHMILLVTSILQQRIITRRKGMEGTRGKGKYKAKGAAVAGRVSQDRRVTTNTRRT